MHFVDIPHISRIAGGHRHFLRLYISALDPNSPSNPHFSLQDMKGVFGRAQIPILDSQPSLDSGKVGVVQAYHRQRPHSTSGLAVVGWSALWG